MKIKHTRIEWTIALATLIAIAIVPAGSARAFANES